MRPIRRPGPAPLRLVPAVVCLALAALLGAASADPVYRIPEKELLSEEFDQLSGYSGSSSTLDGRLDLPKKKVGFLITLDGADAGKIGIGDPWPTDSAAKLAWDPVLHHYTSLAKYGSYQMRLTYFDGPAGSDIDVGLFLNTGLCGPSGYPSNDPTNDTWWGSPWVSLALGQTKTLTLDFDDAEAWNISDNKAPHTGGGEGWADGGWYAINDRDRNEISNLGLQIADFDDDALGSQIEVHIANPEPLSMAFMASAFVGVVAWRRRRRVKSNVGGDQ